MTKPPPRCPQCQALALKPHLPGCPIAEADAKKQVSFDLGTVQACPHSKDGKLCEPCRRLVGE